MAHHSTSLIFIYTSYTLYSSVVPVMGTTEDVLPSLHYVPFIQSTLVIP
nr:MAG TPA: hypothetical protein [Bacteriophage sp.]